ncbi:hypothetical protein CONLIGDRAFT_639026 [Coniochaeta ligniaria NRRL 30616]|uniref:Uncharacterized protein n=1 Tax=Coniochaeta ligniaria NRRL 30616 TaxID=1408157 RepID=A0A1J7J5F2_9PEZI|nr:hypothetical protein CONLIGDRAFT_639026 [Coniochaeta ligniaria NRRL 30616]
MPPQDDPFLEIFAPSPAQIALGPIRRAGANDPDGVEEPPKRTSYDDLDASEKSSCDDLIIAVQQFGLKRDPNIVSRKSRKAFFKEVFKHWDTTFHVPHVARTIAPRSGVRWLIPCGYAGRDLIPVAASSPNNRHQPYGRVAQPAPVPATRRQGATIYVAKTHQQQRLEIRPCECLACP